jgi:hypothetical protein
MGQAQMAIVRQVYEKYLTEKKKQRSKLMPDYAVDSLTNDTFEDSFRTDV